MRTTINIDTRAHTIARAVAKQKDQTLGQVMSEALISTYSPKEDRPRGMCIDEDGWPTIHIGRLITAEEGAEAIAED